MSKNKSFSAGISQRYALALYELSKEENKTDEFGSSLSSFMKIYNSNEDLKNLLYIQLSELEELEVQDIKNSAIEFAETIASGIVIFFTIFGSFSIIVGLLLIFIGICIAQPVVEAPMIRTNGKDIPNIFPLLFVVLVRTYIEVAVRYY